MKKNIVLLIIAGRLYLGRNIGMAQGKLRTFAIGTSPRHPYLHNVLRIEHIVKRDIDELFIDDISYEIKNLNKDALAKGQACVEGNDIYFYPRTYENLAALSFKACYVNAEYNYCDNAANNTTLFTNYNKTKTVPYEPRIDGNLDLSTEIKNTDFDLPVFDSYTISLINVDGALNFFLHNSLINEQAIISVVDENGQNQIVLQKGKIKSAQITYETMELEIADQRNFEHVPILRKAKERGFDKIADTLIPIAYGKNNVVQGINTEDGTNTFLFADDTVGEDKVTHTINRVFFINENDEEVDVRPGAYTDKNGAIELKDTFEYNVELLQPVKLLLKYYDKVPNTGRIGTRSYHSNVVRHPFNDEAPFFGIYVIERDIQKREIIVTGYAPQFNYQDIYYVTYTYANGDTQTWSNSIDVVQPCLIGLDVKEPYTIKEVLVAKTGWKLPNAKIIGKTIDLTRYRFSVYNSSETKNTDAGDKEYLGRIDVKDDSPLHLQGLGFINKVQVAYNMPQNIYIDFTTKKIFHKIEMDNRKRITTLRPRYGYGSRDEVLFDLLSAFTKLPLTKDTFDFDEIYEQFSSSDYYDDVTVYFDQDSLQDALLYYLEKVYVYMITKNGKLTFRNYDFSNIIKEKIKADINLTITQNNEHYATDIILKHDFVHYNEKYKNTYANSEYAYTGHKNYLDQNTITKETFLQKNIEKLGKYLAKKYADKQTLVEVETSQDIKHLTLYDTITIEKQINDFVLPIDYTGKIVSIDYIKQKVSIQTGG